jgi:hypothetical protein
VKTILFVKGGKKGGYTELGNNERLVNLRLLMDTTVQIRQIPSSTIKEANRCESI